MIYMLNSQVKKFDKDYKVVSLFFKRISYAYEYTKTCPATKIQY